MPLTFAPGSIAAVIGGRRFVLGSIASVGVAGDSISAAALGLTRVDALIAVESNGRTMLTNARNSSNGADRADGSVFLRSRSGNVEARVLVVGV